MHASLATARTFSALIPFALLSVVTPSHSAEGDQTANPSRAETSRAETSRAEREALSHFQQLIGEWRGVGQPKRGSAKDAWSEECQWAWSFHDKTASFTLSSPNGKFLRHATLRSLAPKQYELVGESPEGNKWEFRGSPDEEGNLVLLAKEPEEPGPTRITLRIVAGGDRLLMLYERMTSVDRFTRLAEVGMTRKGSGFGQGTNYVECVVTGGLGTIAVMHEGKTYYVCCTGCQDHFRDNPAEVLAEYRARKEEEKKKKKS